MLTTLCPDATRRPATARCGTDRSSGRPPAPGEPPLAGGLPQYAVYRTADDRYVTPNGKARTHREGDDVSVITWGAMVYTADEAAKQLEENDISVEVIDLRTVMPWDKEAVLESVRKTSKVLVLHEDNRTGGFGGEIAATIAEEAFEDLDAPVRRIAAPDCPVPFSPVLEKAFIPQVEDVVKGLRALAEY